MLQRIFYMLEVEQQCTCVNAREYRVKCRADESCRIINRCAMAVISCGFFFDRLVSEWMARSREQQLAEELCQCRGWVQSFMHYNYLFIRRIIAV